MTSRIKKINKKPSAKVSLLDARVAIAIIGICAVLAFDLSGIGGNIRFYTKWIACGQKPVQKGLMFASNMNFYEESPVFTPIRLSPPLFCSPLEAEMSGYSASSDDYTYPHLDEYRKSR